MFFRRNAERYVKKTAKPLSLVMEIASNTESVVQTQLSKVAVRNLAEVGQVSPLGSQPSFVIMMENPF